jgi:type VI secretion system protein ImpA
VSAPAPAAADAFTVDVEAFLAPVPGDDPAGPPLRYDGTYDRVRDARRADDAALSQGVWRRELKRADWATAAAECEAALKTRSKDLQLAAWLVEAWLHLHGFAGAAAGFRLLEALCGRFREGLHPRGADPGDACEARAYVLEWLDGEAAAALGAVPLTTPGLVEAGTLAWADREAALRLENQTRREPGATKAAEAAGAVTLPRFDRAVSLSPTAFHAARAAALAAAAAAAGRLQALLDETCGASAPGLLRVRGVLAAVRGWTEGVLAGRPDALPTPETPMPETPEPAALPDPGADAPPPPPDAPVAVPIAIAGRGPASREEAYRWLGAAADYLARTEPHSPVPYLVRRAVAWGALPLPVLMERFQRDGYDLGALYKLLGFDEPGAT